MADIKISIPDNFIQEEIRCDYTVSKQMKEVWAIQMDLAVQLINVCKKHNIKIFADGGTLIGAARHKGFIPWDDDMDFNMSREDYEKLCKVAGDEFKEPYFFQTEYSDPGCLRGHAQLRNNNTTAILRKQREGTSFNQGIFVDIFPLDEVVDDKVLFEKQKKRVAKAFKNAWVFDCYVYRSEHALKTPIKRLRGVYERLKSHFTDRKALFEKYEKEVTRYNTGTNEFVGPLSFLYSNEKYNVPRKYYSEQTYIPFEWIEMPVPKDYEKVLDYEYGNWRTYEIGTSGHGEVFFDTEHSYRDYLEGKRTIPE